MKKSLCVYPQKTWESTKISEQERDVTGLFSYRSADGIMRTERMMSGERHGGQRETERRKEAVAITAARGRCAVCWHVDSDGSHGPCEIINGGRLEWRHWRSKCFFSTDCLPDDVVATRERKMSNTWSLSPKSCKSEEWDKSGQVLGTR